VTRRAVPAKPETPSAFETLPIRKKRHGADKDRITLGRERTCDIVVRTPGVSKLHACFLPGTPLRLLDVGSQNGTFVDGKRLAAEQPVAVTPGASLVFGDLATRLVTPTELYAMLKSTVR
jgi:pSer/pThr/pTyr-binding forkhead associated (FHA) protein